MKDPVDSINLDLLSRKSSAEHGFCRHKQSRTDSHSFHTKELEKFSSLYLNEGKTTDPPVDSLMHVTTCSPSAHHTDDENFGENSSSFTESSANLVCICRKYSKDSCHLILNFIDLLT